MFFGDNLDKSNDFGSMESSSFRENNGHTQMVSELDVTNQNHHDKCCIDIRLRFQNHH